MTESTIVLIINAFCYLFALTNILPERLKSYQMLLFYFLSLLCLIIFPQFLGQASAFFNLGIMLAFIAVCSRKKLLNLSSALFGYLTNVFLNYALTVFTTRCLDIPLTALVGKKLILFVLIFLLLIIAASSFFGWLLRSRIRIQEMDLPGNVLWCIFTYIFLCCTLFIVCFTYGDVIGYTPEFILAFCTVFGLVFFFSSLLLIFVVRSMQTRQRARQYETLRDYTSRLEELYQKTRSFKHDYLNILSTLSGYIENNDMEGMRSYFTASIAPTAASLEDSNYELGKLSDILTPELKGLLMNKSIHALMSDVHLSLQISGPVTTSYMDSLDLSRLLGIYLDNAVEAAAETSEKALKITISSKDGILSVQILNSFNRASVDLSSLKNLGYSTKGSSRGMGLYTAQQILKKYPQTVSNTFIEKQYFIQALDNV